MTWTLLSELVNCRGTVHSEFEFILRASDDTVMQHFTIAGLDEMLEDQTSKLSKKFGRRQALTTIGIKDSHDIRTLQKMVEAASNKYDAPPRRWFLADPR
jgi:hypothetical protein